MTDIHKPNLGYDLLKLYCDWCVRRSYSMLQVQGIQNIPKDGAVILASNHCNTLLDALVVLRANPGTTVFGARADIFNNPTAAKIVTFLRILPMVRERDGIRNVVKNFDTMDKIADILNDKVAFCFFPEGTHRPKHSILPIRKGLTRMAMVADEKINPSLPLYMVPVGLEYGDYFRYRSTGLVTFGQPIELRSVLHAAENKDMAFFRSCSAMYTDAITQNFTYIPDDENYDGVWALTKVLMAKEPNVVPSIHMDRNRMTVDKIHALMESKPEEMASLLEDARQFDLDRKAAGVSMKSFSSVPMCLRMPFAMLVWSLLFVFYGALSLPMWATAEHLCHRVFKDKAFRNTARFAVLLAFTPIYVIVNLLLWFVIKGWVWRFLLMVSSLHSYTAFYDSMEHMRVLISDFKLLKNKELRARFRGLRDRFEKIK